MLCKKTGQLSYLGQISIFLHNFLYKPTLIPSCVLACLAYLPAFAEQNCTSIPSLYSQGMPNIYDRLATAIIVGQGIPGYTMPAAGIPYTWQPQPNTNGTIGNRVAMPAIGYAMPRNVIIAPDIRRPWQSLPPLGYTPTIGHVGAPMQRTR